MVPVGIPIAVAGYQRLRCFKRAECNQNTFNSKDTSIKGLCGDVCGSELIATWVRQSVPSVGSTELLGCNRLAFETITFFLFGGS